MNGCVCGRAGGQVVRLRWWDLDGPPHHRLPLRPEPSGQPVVQALPLKVNAVGVPLLPVCVAWKPMVVEAPGAIVAL